jgi:hypothetical protein
MRETETNWIKLLGKHLRNEGDDLTQEELPRRWVDLIKYLDEQERKGQVQEGEDRLPDRPH